MLEQLDPAQTQTKEPIRIEARPVPMVLYHDNCNDGLTAAWCVMDAYRSLGDSVDLVPVRYGRPPPDVTGRYVIMVDFSYDRPVLLEMLEKAERIEIYDHHKTAQEQLEGLKHPNLYIEFDMERSGAGIAWDAFHPETETFDRDSLPRPWFVNHVEHNDLWRHSNPKYDGVMPDNQAVIEYIRSHPTSEHFKMYDTWFQGPTLRTGEVPVRVVAEGKAILRAKRILVEQSLDFAREVMLFGEKVWVSNVPFFLSSEVAHELIRENRVGITFYQKSDGFWGLSFRSNDGRSAAEFALKAKALPGSKDGGGHGNAAGATVQFLPWQIDPTPAGDHLARSAEEAVHLLERTESYGVGSTNASLKLQEAIELPKRKNVREALRIVTSTPGITLPEFAQRLGIDPRGAGATAKALHRKGFLEVRMTYRDNKEVRQYFPAGNLANMLRAKAERFLKAAAALDGQT